MPEAAPYFEAIRQRLAVEYNDAQVFDAYTYHLKRTLAEVRDNGKTEYGSGRIRRYQ